MYKYVNTVLVFIAVWFVASFLNGLLSGTAIAILDSASQNAASENMSISFICSFIFSIPFIVLVCLVTIVAQAHGRKGYELFQIILVSTIICAILAALFFINTLGRNFANAKLIAACSIVISSVTAVLFFNKPFKSSE
jgi:Na+-driven multidrug efflux pump